MRALHACCHAPTAWQTTDGSMPAMCHTQAKNGLPRLGIAVGCMHEWHARADGIQTQAIIAGWFHLR